MASDQEKWGRDGNVQLRSLPKPGESSGHVIAVSGALSACARKSFTARTMAETRAGRETATLADIGADIVEWIRLGREPRGLNPGAVTNGSLTA